MSIGYKSCCVPECGRTGKTNPECSYFRFPLDDERCNIWKSQCQAYLDDFTSDYLYRNFRVCSHHFEETMFSSMQKNRLKRTAIPTLLLPGSVTDNDIPMEEGMDEKKEILVAYTPTLLPAFVSVTETDVPVKEEIKEEIEEEIVEKKEILAAPTPAVAKYSLLETVKIEPLEWSETPVSPLEAACQKSLASGASTSRKVELRGKIKNLKRQNERLKSLKSSSKHEITYKDWEKYCENNFDEQIAMFVKTQLRLKNTVSKGSQSTREYKQLALAIYFLGPKVYKYLAKTFRLPSESTLFQISRNWNIPPGLNDFVFSIIETKVKSLAENVRDCVLCVDKMSVKTYLYYNITRDLITGFHQTDINESYEPAQNALVLMARGIAFNWEQPVAYYFVKKTISPDVLEEIIFNCILKLKSINLNVIAMITNQKSDFIKLTKTLNISRNKPYFEINGEKVYYMFDVLHLLKSSRNHFFKYKLKTSTGATDKSYLDCFYAQDKLQSFRLAPKLTNAHVHPNPFQKMDVKFAAQVLSRTVATAIHSLIEFCVFPLSAAPTVDFIDRMDKVFDLLNSSSSIGSKEFNRPFDGSNDQIEFLNEMIEYFNNTTVVDDNGKHVKSSVRFIEGWILSITSFLEIWRICKAQGLTSLDSRKFNNGCLENFFRKIITKGENNKNPTCAQFSTIYKQLFSFNYFEHFDGANSIDDFDQVLSVITPDCVKHYDAIFPASDMFSGLKIDTKDYIELEFPEKNAVVYGCGYFMMKCIEKHSCDVCFDYATATKEVNEATIHCHFRACQTKDNNTFNKLIMPAQSFYRYIGKLESEFCNSFATLSIRANVGKKIKAKLAQIPFDHPCDNFPHDYLLSLFVRVKIFHTLKFLNGKFKSFKDKKIVNLALTTYLSKQVTDE